MVSDFTFSKLVSQGTLILIGIVKISLSAFTALRDFEWSGNPEMPVEMVEILLNTHKGLQGLCYRWVTNAFPSMPNYIV